MKVYRFNQVTLIVAKDLLSAISRWKMKLWPGMNVDREPILIELLIEDIEQVRKEIEKE